MAILSIRALGPGVIGTRHDWLTYFDDSAAVYTAAQIRHAWAQIGTGIPLLFPTIWSFVEALGYLGALGVDPGLLSRLQVVVPVACGALGIYCLSLLALRVAIFPAFIAALVYGFGTVQFNKVVSGHIPYAIGFAVLPWTLLFFARSLEARPWSSRMLLFAACLTAAIASNGVQFIVLVPLTLFAWATVAELPRKALFRAFVCTFCIFAAQAVTIYDSFARSADISHIATSLPLTWFDQNSSGFLAALELDGYPAGYHASAVASPLAHALYLAALGLLFLVSIAAHFDSSRSSVCRLMSLMFVGGVAFLAGTRESLLSPAVTFFFTHVHQALLFNELYNIAVIPALGFAILCAIGLNTLTRDWNGSSNPLSAAIFITILCVLTAPFSVVEAVGLAALGVIAYLLHLRLHSCNTLVKSGFVVLLLLAAGIYIWPTVGSGTWAGQLQTVRPPVADIKRATQLVSADAWHRTLFFPTPQPLTIDGSRFGGNDPFEHVPGNVINESYPTGLLATALTETMFGYIGEARTLLKLLGVRYLVDRPDFRSIFIGYVPSAQAFRSVWEDDQLRACAFLRPDDDRAALQPCRSAVADLGPVAHVIAWHSWNPLPIDVSAIALGLLRDPTSLPLSTSKIIAGRVLQTPSAGVSYPPATAEISLLSGPLVSDPLQGWVSTQLRWYEDPAIAGLPGIYSASGRVYRETFRIARSTNAQLWCAALAWPQGGIIDIAIDGRSVGVLHLNGDASELKAFLLANVVLRPGLHEIALTPELGAWETDAIASLSLRAPRDESPLPARTRAQSILLGRAVDSSLVLFRGWVSQLLEARTGAHLTIHGSHVDATNEWFLLHRRLPSMKVGDYVATFRWKRYHGLPMRINVISDNNDIPLASRLLPEDATVARIPFTVQQARGVTFFLYGDSRKQPFSEVIEPVQLTRVVAAAQVIRRIRKADAPRPIACRQLTPTAINCDDTLSGPMLLELKESYSPFWTLCVQSPTHRCEAVDQRNHFIANGFDNAWYVDARSPVILRFNYAPDSMYTSLYKVQQATLLALSLVCAVLVLREIVKGMHVGGQQSR